MTTGYRFYGEADWQRTSICAGYPSVYCPSHPRAWSTGYIHSHVLIAERQLGRLLSKTECVHHRNGVRTDNRVENLVVTTRANHGQTHATYAKTIMLTCVGCNKTFPRKGHRTLRVRRGGRPFCSQACYRSHNQAGLRT